MRHSLPSSPHRITATSSWKPRIWLRGRGPIRHYWKLRATTGNLFIHERYMKRYRGITAATVTPYLLAKCKALRERIVRDWSTSNDIKYLDSIPGITPFLAATILAELQPLDRFQRVEQVIALPVLIRQSIRREASQVLTVVSRSVAHGHYGTHCIWRHSARFIMRCDQSMTDIVNEGCIIRRCSVFSQERYCAPTIALLRNAECSMRNT